MCHYSTSQCINLPPQVLTRCANITTFLQEDLLLQKQQVKSSPLLIRAFCSHKITQRRRGADTVVSEVATATFQGHAVCKIHLCGVRGPADWPVQSVRETKHADGTLPWHFGSHCHPHPGVGLCTCADHPPVSTVALASATVRKASLEMSGTAAVKHAIYTVGLPVARENGLKCLVVMHLLD